MKSNREEIVESVVELIITILQICVFIGFCYLIINNLKQSIGLGYILCLFWWELGKIAENSKK